MNNEYYVIHTTEISHIINYCPAYLKKMASRNVIPGIKLPIAEARVGELYLIPVIANICTKHILQHNFFFHYYNNISPDRNKPISQFD